MYLYIQALIVPSKSTQLCNNSKMLNKFKNLYNRICRQLGLVKVNTHLYTLVLHQVVLYNV